jgi:hypothetical protein
MLVVVMMMMVVVVMAVTIPPVAVMMVVIMSVVVVMMVVVNELHVRIPARTLASGRGRGGVGDPQEGEGIGYRVE